MKRHDVLGGDALTLLASIILIIGIGTISYAHGVLSREIETGKVGFTYDDGSPLAGGHVSVQDKEGNEIATGQTDAEGVFDYSTYENAGEISVTDTHGHHRTHVIGATQDTHATDHSHAHSHDHHSGENTAVVIVVVAVLLAIAAVFYLGNKKKNGSQ